MKLSFPLLCSSLCLVLSACHPKEQEPKITEYVNPFIGTADHGHCFPGAIVPFGGIQLSPDNPRIGWDWCSGYHYTDSIISSFSLTHLSGTGIGDLQDIRFLPVITRPDSGTLPVEYIQSEYARFTHENEQAEPGYYSVVFDNGIKTELSVTQRCGIQYYQYPADAKIRALTLDLSTARNWDKTMETSIRKVNNRMLEGYR
ncbi:MAG: glycoside hydrolase family 92 protein, partial [Odoribacter sp.]|nr:glycoside hydrolase family 92 protein [Odoribacter sp.]